MPRFYLLRPDGSYSDSADYPEQPVEREDGTWVAGVPNGLAPYNPLSLAQRLEIQFIQALAELGNAIQPEEEADFFILKAAVIEALKFDRVNAAKALILKPQGLSPELEFFRGKMLEEFPNG